MIRFDDIRTDEARAHQIYIILIGLANERKIITYKILADYIGFDGAGVFAGILGHIMYWCDENRLPPLTILVVNEKTGLPGEGLILKNDLNHERERVFREEWYGIVPPTIKELDDCYQRNKS